MQRDNQVKDHQVKDNQVLIASSAIVDIVTFCNSPDYLDLPSSGLNLYTSQRVILKSFYAGSRGNENLSLDEEEKKWLCANCEVHEMSQTINKIAKQRLPFKELCVVAGRRGSKDTLSFIIAIYELYKLIVVNGGNPHGFYRVDLGEEISVSIVTTSMRNNDAFFGRLKKTIKNAPFFKRLVFQITGTKLSMATSCGGKVCVECGHSNPDFLRGTHAVCVVFNELGYYDNKCGKVTGTEFYEALRPSIDYFEAKGDGRMVEISSSAPKNGKLYEVFNNSKSDDSILSFRLPTWVLNPEVSYNSPVLEEVKRRSPAMFAVEFGAEWPETSFKSDETSITIPATNEDELLIVKVGSEERPASDEDIEYIQKLLVKCRESNAGCLVTHHAVSFEVIKKSAISKIVAFPDKD